MNLGFTEKKVGKKWIVVCGNYQEFNVFCDIEMKEYEGGEDYFEGDEFIYYSHPDSVRGLRAYGIIAYGNYKNRDDIDYPRLKACVNYKE
jgi:hypothetical protein